MGEAPSFSSYGLQWCLRQLGKEEFQTFKDLLKETMSEQAAGSLPWVEVDNSNLEHLASLLLDHCGPLIWKTCVDIFHEMNLPLLSRKAGDEMEKSSLAETLGDSTRPKPDEGTSVDELPATEQGDPGAAETKDQDQGGDGWDYRRHVMTKFAATPSGTHPGLETWASGCPQRHALLDVFVPDRQGCRPLTVVLHGESGAGKSALARWILLSWARGDLYATLFSYVFLLDARDIPLEEESSFGELISRQWPDCAVPLTKVLSQPEGLLFVVDGLEDLDVPSDEADVTLCADWTERRTVRVLIRSLLRKVLLPESSLLVTVSHEGVETLKAVVTSPRYLFIRGPPVEARVPLFADHLQDEDQKRQAWRWGADSHLLTDGCQVPATCSLIGRALELQVASGTSLSPRCQVLTGLYATIVVHQLAPRRAPGRSLSLEDRVAVKGLCRMAAQGVWAAKFAFHADDPGPHGLTEPELSSLFRKNLLVRGSRGDGRFTFLHPSLQAFCAALSYVLEGLESEWYPRPPRAEPVKGPRPLGRVRHNAHLRQMKRFLFGLMNEELGRTLEDLLGCPLAPVARQVLLHWVFLLGQQAGDASPLDFLEVFYCLFETQEDRFVRLALTGFQEVRLTVNRPMDLLVSSFCIQHCQHLRKVHMDVREIFPEDETAEVPLAALQGVQIKPPVTVEWWENLCSVLGTHPHLRELDLSSSVLTEWAIRTLCLQLRRPTCRVQTLILKGTQITLGLHHLWKTLLINSTIQHLNLENTHLKDADVGVAYEALKHPHCALESLRLDQCGLTHTCCPLLSQILLASGSLKSLSLSGNKVADQGCELLCEALKISHCTLQRLMLSNCGVTATSCRDLASILSGNRRLTHLDLSGNRLGTEGVTVLCRALKLVNCALQRLMLRECSLDVVGCGFLALGLVSNRHLTHLSLSLNPLGDEGLHLLCEVMVETPCHLQDLELVHCHLTATCCRNLCAVITKNRHLKSLDLTANPLGDAGVAVLCEGLKQRTASLRRLGLEACGLTSDCCGVLSEALTCNQRLSSLNLMRNNFGPEGIAKLCSAFEHPASHLQVIGLWKSQFLAPTRSRLEEVQARKPHLVIGHDWHSFDEDDRFWWKH